MDREAASRLSHTLSIRLTDVQLRRLQSTLRNFGIKEGSMSDQLRALFKEVHLISLRHRDRLREAHVKIQAEAQAKIEEISHDEEIDEEEEEAYREWFNSLGSDSS